jgi:hypothetical protein
MANITFKSFLQKLALSLLLNRDPVVRLKVISKCFNVLIEEHLFE